MSNLKVTDLVPWGSPRRNWRKIEAYYVPSKGYPDMCEIVPYCPTFRHIGASIQLDHAARGKVS